MSLKVKLIFLLVSVLSFLALISFTFFKQVISSSFLEVEELEAIKDMQRVVYAIQNETAHLSVLNHDWAAWDATYDFITTRSTEYVEENLPVSSFTDNTLNLICFYDVHGTLIWGESRDLESEELLEIKDFSGERLPEDHLLLTFPFDKSPLSEVSINGIWITEHGPMLLSSRPILNNDNKGPVRGTLVMGRFLDNTVVTNLNRQTKVNFSVFSLGQYTFPKPLQEILPVLNPEEPIYLDRTDDTIMKMYTTIPDLNGDTGLLIQASKKRDIYEKSQTVMKYSIASVSLVMITVFALMSLFMHKIVVGPINTLIQHVLYIGRSGNLSHQSRIQSNDEIGILSAEFDSMIAKLHETKHKLQQQSYQQGMSELASGILHNLRNALHKQFNNIELLKKTLEKTPVDKIMRACHELHTVSNNEKRKADLIDFLVTANESLLHCIDKAKKQLDRNSLFVEEIEETLGSYEKWAHKEIIIEELLIEPLVREAYKFVEKYSQVAISFQIDPKANAVGYVMSNRVILFQVVVNILMNAIESINKTQEVQGEIRIEADNQEMDYGQAVHLRFWDNGAGMDNTVVKNLFKRGFTTKNKEFSGLGLHWCVNAIESVQGKLYAESSGPGSGACFHLVLPRKI